MNWQPLITVLGIALVSGCSDPMAVEKTSKRSRAVTTSADAQSDAYSEVVGHVCAQRGNQIGLFGEQTVTVPADAYWTSSGLYVKRGERVEVSASGEWTIWKDRTLPFGANGHPELSMLDNCRKGSLVARIGLSSSSPSLCIGEKGSFLADRAGIVYFAMHDNASPTYHGGELKVTIASDADRAPVVSYAEAADFEYCQVASGWVEIASKHHVLLTVPADLADLYREDIQSTLDFFDDAYSHMRDLTGGGTPFGGQRIRFYPDFGVGDAGWLRAGNPVVLDPKHLNAVDPSESALLGTGNSDYSSFDFLRAMGVAFARYRGSRYQVDEEAAQAFGGLFSLYAMERLERRDLPQSPCKDRDLHQEEGSFTDFLKDDWLQLCLLAEVQDRADWGLYARFFSSLPERDAWDETLAASATPVDKWIWIAKQLVGSPEPALETVNSTDNGGVSTIFTSFHLPIK